MIGLIKTCLTLTIIFTANSLFASDLAFDKKLKYGISHCYIFMIDSKYYGIPVDVRDSLVYDADKRSYELAEQLVEKYLRERYSMNDLGKIKMDAMWNANALKDMHRSNAEKEYSKWLFWGRQEKVNGLYQQKLYKEIENCRNYLSAILGFLESVQ